MPGTAQYDSHGLPWKQLWIVPLYEGLHCSILDLTAVSNLSVEAARSEHLAVCGWVGGWVGVGVGVCVCGGGGGGGERGSR